MRRGGSSRKKSHGKAKHEDEFPSAWSEWEWDDGYNSFFRYREINNTGNEDEDYEYDYRESGSRGLGTIAEGSTSTYTYASPPIDPVTQLSQQLSQSSIQPTNDTGRLIQSHDVKELDKSFQVHKSKEFKLGRVFKIVWVEPKGTTGTEITQDKPPRGKSSRKVRQTIFGESSYTSVRRFVIIRTQTGHSVCVPVLTYQGSGLNKYGVKAHDHCIIYTADKPSYMEGEVIVNDPIRMTPEDHRNQLDEASRINLAKPYTVEHNIKVCFIGYVAGTDLNCLLATYNRINATPYPQASGQGTPRSFNEVAWSSHAPQAGPSTSSYPGSSNHGAGV